MMFVRMQNAQRILASLFEDWIFRIYSQKDESAHTPGKKNTEPQKWAKAGGLEDDAPFRFGVTIGFHVRFRELLVSPSDVSKRKPVPDVPSPASVRLEGWV